MAASSGNLIDELPHGLFLPGIHVVVIELPDPACCLLDPLVWLRNATYFYGQ